ncbi:MAG: DUF3606 domain-containing protein [Pedobacter sp.]|uniref:DUF3606 domain-containing protein n=1 Tax=Pedobacter sp. TaxID=1411316 RepID=UPI00339A173E
MSDSKNKQDGRDDSKIDSHDASEVEYAAKEFGVSPKEVRDAIGKVGSSRAAVKKELNK